MVLMVKKGLLSLSNKGRKIKDPQEKILLERQREGFLNIRLVRTTSHSRTHGSLKKLYSQDHTTYVLIHPENFKKMQTNIEAFSSYVDF